jgi:hypothetical protein
MADDADLIDMLGYWVSRRDVWRRIFIENPERLYGFDPL